MYVFGRFIKSIGNTLVAIFVLVIVAPFLALIGTVWGWQKITSLWYGLNVKRKWFLEGKCVLFVYSQTEKYAEYVEANILPQIASQAKVLEWSNRHDKESSFALKVFLYFSNQKLNRLERIGLHGLSIMPFAVVFSPWYKPKIFRFWKALRKYRAGKPELLKKEEDSFYRSLNPENA